jgi:hypothetical protein
VLRMSPLPPSGVRTGIWSELREGWDEFRSRTWVWAMVAIMGVPSVLVLLVPDIWRLGPPKQLPEPELAVLP